MNETEHDFHQYAVEYIESIQAETGVWLDRHFTGYSLSGAAHIDISPAVAALMRTEVALGTRVAAGTNVRFDLKELEQVSPPGLGDNLFVTFMITSLSDPSGDALAFALHLTRLAVGEEPANSLLAHIFKPGATLESAYSVIVYALSSTGEMRLATSRLLIGLGPEGELIAYQLVGLGNVDGGERSIKPPSDQMMFLLFLTLSAFMLVNQGESTLKQTGERKYSIG